MNTYDLKNKRRFLFFLMCMACTLPMSALVVTIDGLVYDLNGSSATVKNVAEGNRNSSIIVPSSVIYQGERYLVTNIGDYAFCNYYTLSEYWGGSHEYAYYDYYAINGESHYINRYFSSYWIERHYHGCEYNSYVTSIVLPSSIVSIGTGAFYNNHIDYVEFGLGITSIPDYAFSHSRISSIVIPESVVTIGAYAFSYSELTSIIIPNNVKTIGDNAFQGSKLTNAIISSAAESFGEENIFNGCDLLRSIVYLGKEPPAYWVATTQTYVPNNKYTEPPYYMNDAHIYSGNEWVATAFSALNWDKQDYTFVYSGNKPDILCLHNIEGYTVTYNSESLNKNVGSWSTSIPVTFTNEEGSFTADCIYNYTIQPAPLKVSVKNATRNYGDENPKFDILYDGFVNSEDETEITTPPNVSTSATAKSDVGTYPITASEAIAQNYTFSYEEGEMTVLPAHLTIKVNNATKTYGTDNPSFSCNYIGLKNDETEPSWKTMPVFTTEATKASDVGIYGINVTCEPKNYTIVANQSGTLTIEPAPLMLKVNDASRPYYADNPIFTYACSGFVNDDDVSVLTKQPVITPDADHNSEVGTYDLIAKDAEAKNYDISYQSGKMTITRCPLMVTADATTREYGEPNPTFTFSYDGFVGGETESVLSELPTVTTMADNYSNVGTYDLRVSGGRATNYTLSYQNGTLTITKAPLSAKIEDVTRMYGEQNPTSYHVTYFGLKNAESSPAWITKPHAIFEADQNSGVGEYSIRTSECEALNYDLKEIAPGTLTITPAPLTIQAQDATRKYYSDNPAFSYNCYGFVNGDNASVLTSTPTLTTTATLTSSVGTYEIKVGETSTPNYSISYINGTLTITKRTLIASVGNYERAYNEENPAFEVELEGFAGGEDEKVISVIPSAQTLATKTSDVGSYRIDVTGGNAENYNFSYASGTLTINKAEQAITWNQDLSGLKVGDQVMLNAVASSGLPITYTMEDERFAEVYSVGDNYYLDCINRGKFAMRAVQNGNKNYYSSPRVSNNVTISGGTYSDQYVKLSDAGYATFYDEFCDYKLPAGWKANVVSQATDSKLSYITIAEGDNGDVIPAGVAVLLEGSRRSADTYALKPSDTSKTYSGPNLLHGSDNATTTTADGNCMFYKLAYGPSGTELKDTFGWFWGEDDGKPFTIEGHKAWLAIPRGSAVKSRPLFYAIDGNAICLEKGVSDDSIMNQEHGSIYDLQGRRVENPTKRGIYIRDGKKIYVR